MLNDLGFVTATLERGSPLESVPAKGFFPKQKTLFLARKLGLVASDRLARVLRKDVELAAGKVLDQVSAVVYVPDARAFVLWSGSPGREACEGSDPTVVTVLPLASAP